MGLENMLWASTRIASSTPCFGLVVYTGAETRAALNRNKGGSKLGKFEIRLNNMGKVLFVLLVVVSVFFCLMSNYNRGSALKQYILFLILMTWILPLSMRSCVDSAKIYSGYRISKDTEIPGSVARSLTTPEDLGLIEFLFTDKTGTLTQNSMQLKQLALSKQTILQINSMDQDTLSQVQKLSFAEKRSLEQSVLALSLCHSVKVVSDQDASLTT